MDSFDWDCTLVIADETAKVKTPNARRTKAFLKVTYWAKYVWELTGAPQENGPQDLWSQYFAIDRGRAFCSTFDDYYNKFLTCPAPNRYSVKRERALELELAVQLYGLRYSPGECDQWTGKTKAFQWIKTAPNAEQITANNDLVYGVVRLMSDVTVSLDERARQAIVQLGYLREIACGWNKVRLAEDMPYTRFRFSYSPKSLWLLAFLLGNEGVPVVYFSEFDEDELIQSEMMEREGITYAWVKRDGHVAVDRFQKGEVRVIILKTDQGYGISLNRIPAVKAGIGCYPVIIYGAPTWKYGSFIQSQERCVGTDPQTGKSIKTPVYVLALNSGIEDRVISILRRKGDMSEGLLKDQLRKGYESFLETMTLKHSSEDDVFDAEDMAARIELRIGPEKRPTHKLIKSLVPGASEESTAIIGNHELTVEQRRLMAANYLLSKYDSKGYKRK